MSQPPPPTYFIDPITEPKATLFNPWCSMVGALAVHYDFDVALYDRLMRRHFLQQGLPRYLAEAACAKPSSIHSYTSNSAATVDSFRRAQEETTTPMPSGLVNRFPELIQATRRFKDLTSDQKKRAIENLSLLPCKSTSVNQYSLILILWFAHQESAAAASISSSSSRVATAVGEGMMGLFLTGRLPVVAGKLLNEPEGYSQFWKTCYFAAILGGHVDALDALLGFSKNIRNASRLTTTTQGGRNSHSSGYPTFGIGNASFLGQLMKVAVEKPPAALALARDTKLEMKPNPLVCAVRLRDQECIRLCLRENPSLMVNTPEEGVSVAGTVSEEMDYYRPVTNGGGTTAMAVAIENHDSNSIIQLLPYADASFLAISGKSAGYQWRGSSAVQMNERGTFPRLLMLARPDILRLFIRKAITAGGRWQDECDFTKNKVMNCFTALVRQGEAEMVELMIYWMKGYEPNGFLKEEYHPGSGYKTRLVSGGANTATTNNNSSSRELLLSDIAGEPPLHCCLRSLGKLGEARTPTTYRPDPYQRIVELMIHFGSNPFLTEVHSQEHGTDGHMGTWNNVFHALAASAHLESYCPATTPLASASPGSPGSEEQILEYFEAVIRERGTQIVTWEDPRDTETAISRIVAAILRQMVAAVDSSEGDKETVATLNLDPNPNRKKSTLDLSSPLRKNCQSTSSRQQQVNEVSSDLYSFDESPMRRKPNFHITSFLDSGRHLLEKTLEAEAKLSEERTGQKASSGGGSVVGGVSSVLPCTLFAEFLKEKGTTVGGKRYYTASSSNNYSSSSSNLRPIAMGCMSWEAFQLYVATLTAYNSNGETPLHVLMKKDCPDLLFELLLPIMSLAHQAMVKSSSSNGATEIASEDEAEKEIDFISKLLRAILNIRDKSGKTLLHHGATQNSYRNLNCLLLASRFLFTKSKDGNEYLLKRKKNDDQVSAATSTTSTHQQTQQQHPPLPPTLSSLFLETSARDYSKDRLKPVDIAVKMKQHEALIALQVPQFPLKW